MNLYKWPYHVIIDFIKAHWFLCIMFLYLILLINKTSYELRIFLLDLINL